MQFLMLAHLFYLYHTFIPSPSLTRGQDTFDGHTFSTTPYRHIFWTFFLQTYTNDVHEIYKCLLLPCSSSYIQSDAYRSYDSVFFLMLIFKCINIFCFLGFPINGIYLIIGHNIQSRQETLYVIIHFFRFREMNERVKTN